MHPGGMRKCGASAIIPVWSYVPSQEHRFSFRCRPLDLLDTIVEISLAAVLIGLNFS